MAILLIGAAIFFALILLTLLRFHSITPYFNPSAPPTRTSKTPPHVLILLGSGGHTAEMLSLFSALPSANRYKRTYVFSSGDSFSAVKAAAFEAQLQQKAGATKQDIASLNYNKYTLLEIPRARKVGQSWLTTPLSCIICIIGCLRAFTTGGMPDVVVCNGPGSAVMMVAVCFLYKFFGLCTTRTIYVESFARVKSLSLSGRLLYPVVDRFIVQWPGLKERWVRAEYHGILI